MANNDFCYAVGIMSGTSLDGIDVAVVKIFEKNDRIKLDLVHFASIPYADEIRQKILRLCDPNLAKIEMISGMNMLLGSLFAEATLKVIGEAGLHRKDISFISSHGQTIFHQPEKKDIGGHSVISTLQIGDISVIAEKTGITTVGDFRTRDMAVGGQGAPLVPYADFLLFRGPNIGRVLVNIGGIANITVLPPNCEESDVWAYDTGPGNLIIDYFANRITDGKQTYDRDGALASMGAIHQAWLEKLLQEQYYAQAPPKSTGRELFGAEYASQQWEEAELLGISYADRIATVTELTAVTLTECIQNHIAPARIQEVFISGGGSNNPVLMKRIKHHLSDAVKVKRTDEIGMPADAKEAMVFALLGYQYWNKRTNNLPAATGASRKVTMGKVAWGQ